MTMRNSFFLLSLAMTVGIGCSSPKAIEVDRPVGWASFQDILNSDIHLDREIPSSDIEAVVNQVLGLHDILGLEKILSIELREDGMIWLESIHSRRQRSSSGKRLGFTRQDGKWVLTRTAWWGRGGHS